MKPEEITPELVDRMMRGMGMPVDGIWRPDVERGLRALCDRRKGDRRVSAPPGFKDIGTSPPAAPKAAVTNVPEVSEGMMNAALGVGFPFNWPVQGMIKEFWKAMYSKHLEELGNPDLGIR